MTDEQFQKLAKYLTLLVEGKPLPPEAKDHELLGVWQGFREFHLGGDLLVIYRQTQDEIVLARIGTHNQLFKD
ncbi:type II toxin-antitoxin system YafQ family toxin [Thermodesulfatator indicus]